MQINLEALERFPNAKGIEKAVEVGNDCGVDGVVFNLISEPLNLANVIDVYMVCKESGIDNIYVLDGNAQSIEALGILNRGCNLKVSVTTFWHPKYGTAFTALRCNLG